MTNLFVVTLNQHDSYGTSDGTRKKKKQRRLIYTNITLFYNSPKISYILIVREYTTIFKIFLS